MISDHSAVIDFTGAIVDFTRAIVDFTAYLLLYTTHKATNNWYYQNSFIRHTKPHIKLFYRTHKTAHTVVLSRVLLYLGKK